MSAPYLLPLADPCDSDQATCRLMWDLTGNETASRASDILIGRPAAVLGLVLLGLAARWVLHRLIDRLVRRAEDGMLPGRLNLTTLGTVTLGSTAVGTALGVTEDPASGRRVQRARTMGSLLKSIVTGVIFTVVVIMSISEIGYDIGPLIAGAGILGVALGFGAQSLVKDFLSGIFMIFEDQYGVGDVIDAGEANGTVEAVGLRVTRLRDVNGTVWYVRNGEVVRIGNMSQNWARTVLDIAVSYKQDLPKIRRVLKEVAHDLWEDDDFKGRVIEEPEVWGVEALGPETVTVRVTLKTAPMEQWAIARELRERIKARFDYEGIEIPVPQRVVWQQPESSGVTATEPPATEG